MFDCKTYTLLKESNVSPRFEKMKSRAFVSYLVGYDSTNIFRIWNSEKSDVSEYRNVIFHEKELYNIYNKKDLIKKSERKNYVLFRTYTIKSVTDIVELLNSDEEEWLKTSVRDRLVLKNSKENLKRSFSKRPENQDDEVVKKSIDQKDDSIQLSTSFESSSPQLILRQSDLTEDERISRFQSEDAEDAVDSSNVIVRRKDKNKKSESSRSESSRFDQLSLFEIDQISLNVIDFQIDLRLIKNIESVDLNKSNIIDEKRTRKSTSRYSIDRYV